MTLLSALPQPKPSFDPLHTEIYADFLPMADDSPATKGDIILLKGDMKQLKQELHGEMRQMKEEIFRYFDLKQQETFRHFDLSVETIRHDLLGANHDEIEVLKDARKNHDKRIVVLEEHAGIRR